MSNGYTIYERERNLGSTSFCISSIFFRWIIGQNYSTVPRARERVGAAEFASEASSAASSEASSAAQANE